MTINPRRIATRRTAACVVAALAPLFAAVAQPAAPAPDALWAEATLYRDEWGVPHVFADSLRALAFAFGYAQAEDHAEPMLMAYRVASGRAAEVLGEAYAASDEFALKMGHRARAEKALAQASEATRTLCEGFAQGVNLWLAGHPDRVPPWATGVHPADVLALWHAYVIRFAPFDVPEVFHPGPPAHSGSAWALAPERTESGHAILVVNPHQFHGGPFQFYEAHLVSGLLGLNVSGATLFGLPVLLMGHNASMGWALTPNRADFADAFLHDPPHLSKRDLKRMNLRGLEAERVLEMALAANAQTYRVRTSTGLAERGVPCIDMAGAPVLGIQRGQFCTFQVGGFHEFEGFLQLLEMARAADLEAFKAALELAQLPCFHIVYAGADGHIFYRYNVLAAEKYTAEFVQRSGQPDAPFVDWNLPVPGADPLFAWGAYIPPAGLPQLEDPEAGYVQACGNPPWTATTDSGIDPEAWPSWFAQDRDTWRARRVRQLFGRGTRSFRDCQAALYDVNVPQAAVIAPWLATLAQQRPELTANAHPDLAAGLELLARWDRRAQTSAAGMTLFHVWWTSLRMLDPQRFPTDAALHAGLEADAPAAQALALHAAAQAVRTMRNEFGGIETPWGDVHVIRRGEREEPIGGAATGEPIFLASDYAYAQGRWPVTYGYGYAMAVEFSDPPRAVSMVPFGASEDPASPHFDDQLDLMLERRFKVTRFVHDDVQRNAVSARGYYPYLRPRGLDGAFALRAQQPIEARLYTAYDPPEPLPEGLAPFSAYIGVEYVPREVPAALTMTAVIPGALCRRDDLTRLTAYVFDRSEGWTPLPKQTWDVGRRTLTAEDDRPRVYVVLGPEACRKEPAEPELPDAPQDAPAAPAAPAMPIPTPDMDAPRPGDAGRMLIEKRAGPPTGSPAPARPQQPVAPPPSHPAWQGLPQQPRVEIEYLDDAGQARPPEPGRSSLLPPAPEGAVEQAPPSEDKGKRWWQFWKRDRR